MRWLVACLAAALLLTAGACGFIAGDGESKQMPGPLWTGQGRQGMSQAEAESFRQFGLYWWGPEFAGFNLQAILSTPGEVTFIYGTCTIPRFQDGGCATPVTIQIQPLCALPLQTVRQAYPGPEETLREGALILRRYIPERSEATATFWAGDAMVRVSVGTGAPDRFEEALDTLRGLNNPIAPGAPLPAPDFERCS